MTGDPAAPVVDENESPGADIAPGEVPHVLAYNQLLFEDPRHRLSLREIRVHAQGAIVVMDRVFRRLRAEERLAYRLAAMDSYAAGEGKLVSVPSDGSEVCLKCVLSDAREARNASWMLMEYWLPGIFGEHEIELSLRGTDIAPHVDFRIEATALDHAQAQVPRYSSSVLGFPEG